MKRSFALLCILLITHVGGARTLAAPPAAAAPAAAPRERLLLDFGFATLVETPAYFP